MDCPHEKVRLQAFKAWMELQGLSYHKIAKSLGVSEQFVAQVMSGRKRLPDKRRSQLLNMGLPEHLLPGTACRHNNPRQWR